MPRFDLASSQASDYSSLDAYSIPSMNMDSPQAQKENVWTNSKAHEYWGWFNQSDKVKNAVLMKAIWDVGKGWEADVHTTNILKSIRGSGKDTYKDILFNLDCQLSIFGQCYAEIITHNKKKISEGGIPVNLKPMSPLNMRHVYGNDGMLIRFEQINSIKEAEVKFDPEEVFYIANNRIGDEMHGSSDLEALRKIILADSQNFDNMNQITNFQAKPFIVFKLKTDDTAKIAAFATKIKNARNLGEDMFVPDDENLLEYEVITVNPSAVLMQWRDDLRNAYYRGIGLPQIVPGGSGQGTESEAKVIFAAFEQIVEHRQKVLEDAHEQQLGLTINLTHPTMMSDILQVQEQKNAGNVFNTQQGEMNPASKNQS